MGAVDEAARDSYQSVLERSRQRTIFAQPWWLDITTGGPDGWQPHLLRTAAGQAVAAWPMPVRTTRSGAVATGAPYTPFLGPLLPDRSPGVARVSADVELLEQLAELVSSHAHVEAACAPELDYWTPLSWHGFTQTSRTTWRIPAGTSPGSVRDGMRKGTRSTLQAAERDDLRVEPGTADELLAACAATFERQPSGATPAAATLRALADAATERGQGQVLVVRTAGGELASAGLFVWDDRWTWNLANGRLELPGVTGAPTLLLWNAIGQALERGTGFDFEGSMLKPVERFVRGFGGEPVAYAAVRRSSPAWERTVRRRRRIKRLLRR